MDLDLDWGLDMDMGFGVEIGAAESGPGVRWDC